MTRPESMICNVEMKIQQGEGGRIASREQTKTTNRKPLHTTIDINEHLDVHEEDIQLLCIGNFSLRRLLHYRIVNWFTQSVHVSLLLRQTRPKDSNQNYSNTRPLAGFWDVTIPHHCIDQIRFELVAAMLNIVVDLVIMVLPLPTIWSLQLPKRQKWALSGVFMLGTL